MLTDHIEKINYLLKELEHKIDEYDIDKAKVIISEFNAEVKKALEDPSKLDESHYNSIQISLNRLSDLVAKVINLQQATGMELGTIVNVKKKLNIYKNNK